MKDIKTLIKLLSAILIVVCFLWLQFRFDLISMLSTEAINGYLDSSGPLAPIVFMFLMALAIVISPLPSLPLDIAAGAYFGPIMGTIYALTGATVGALLSFCIARFLGRPAIEKLIGGHVSFCSLCSTKILARMIFVSRLIPFVSFDIVSYGAGLTKISWRSFIVATFFGMIPLTLLYTYSGSAITGGSAYTLVGGVIIALLLLALPRYLEKSGKLSGMIKRIHDSEKSTECD